jgi:hypothetical protein
MVLGGSALVVLTLIFVTAFTVAGEDIPLV